MYQSVIKQIEKTYRDLGTRIDTLNEQRLGLLRSLKVCHQKTEMAHDHARTENARANAPAAPGLFYFPKSTRPGL